MRAALAVYNGEATIANIYTYFRDSSVEAGPEFPFLDCMSYLRQTVSWQFIISSKQKKQEKRNESFHLSGASVEDDVSADPTSTPEELADAPRNSQHPRLGATAGLVPNSDAVTISHKRPIGTKRALETTKQYHALKKGAEGIEKLAEASLKRNKVAEELLSVEKQQSLVALFSMPGTDLNLQKRFIELSQIKAIALLESEVGTRDHGSGNSTGIGSFIGGHNSSPFQIGTNAGEADSISPDTGSQSVLSLLN